jgi:peptide-methionine (S)-S-oxide reductase
LPGVIRTRVGFTGGTKKNPTYDSLGDHTESLQIDFDPTIVSYEKLLEIFWSTKNHCAVAGSRQYMSAVFYSNDAQRKLAEKTRAEQTTKLGQKITTSLLPLETFYLAEDYHQKYYLQQCGPLWKEVRAMYPKQEAFLRSTVAARINGYVAGQGRSTSLAKEIDGFGLSPAGRRLLVEIVKSRQGS